MKLYTLVEGRPEPCDDVVTWGRWCETADRVLLTTMLNDVTVSTVFLGLDHNRAGHGAPILWETMIFGGPHAEYQERYTSAAAALEGHERAVKIATAGRAIQSREE